MSVEERLDRIDENLKLVLLLVKGNHLDTSDKGMTGKVADQELRIRKMEDNQKKVAYTFAGMCAIAGYAGLKLLQTLFASLK